MNPPTAAHLRDLTETLAARGPFLRDMPHDRVLSAIVTAAAQLRDPSSELGARARTLLPASTGLTPPMVDWALTSTLATVTFEALDAFVAAAAPRSPAHLAVPARLATAVLAGNVFTAALRAVLAPLLLRVPVIAKASSRDDAFPQLLRLALAASDPELGECYQAVTFAGGHTQLEDALFAAADVVSVYGSNHTIETIQRRLPVHSRLVPHGHGLGAAYVPRDALTASRLHAVTRALALDVAAYDQRGCLSPQVIFVERGGDLSARDLCESLASAALPELARSLPRGALPVEVGALQVQWRGVATVAGELFEGDGHAVALEAGPAFRIGPGYRNVSVVECDDTAHLCSLLAPLGAHLKALGVAGSGADLCRLARVLPAPLAPRVSAIGAMQSPPFDALADGDPLWAPFRRFVEVG